MSFLQRTFSVREINEEYRLPQNYQNNDCKKIFNFHCDRKRIQRRQ